MPLEFSEADSESDQVHREGRRSGGIAEGGAGRVLDRERRPVRCDRSGRSPRRPARASTSTASKANGIRLRRRHRDDATAAARCERHSGPPTRRCPADRRTRPLSAAAARRRSAARSALPEPSNGSWSRRSTCSGVLNTAMPRPENQCRHSSRSKGSLGLHERGHPLAHERVRDTRPRRRAAPPGCASSAASTSEAEMFSPPRMMTSLSRPTMRSHPSSSTVARSPVRNHPPGAMTVAVWAASA